MIDIQNLKRNDFVTIRAKVQLNVDPGDTRVYLSAAYSDFSAPADIIVSHEPTFVVGDLVVAKLSANCLGEILKIEHSAAVVVWANNDRTVSWHDCVELKRAPERVASKPLVEPIPQAEE